MSIDIHWLKRGIVSVFEGSTRLQDHLAFWESLPGNPAFDDIRYIFGDLRNTGASDIDTEGIDKIVAHMQTAARCNPSVHHAVVLPEGESRQAIVAYFVFLSGELPWKTECFNTPEEAKAWLQEQGKISSFDEIQYSTGEA